MITSFKLNPIASAIIQHFKPTLLSMVIIFSTASFNKLWAADFPYNNGNSGTVNYNTDDDIDGMGGTMGRLVLPNGPNNDAVMNINGIILTILGFNSPDNGGAISLASGTTLNINLNNNGSVIFQNNRTNNRGGAISNQGTIGVGDNASFSGNSAGFVGGAFSNTLGSTTIGNNAIFSENSAVRFGGAIINNNSGSVIIGNDASFSGNLAENNNGGAIENQRDANFAIGDGAKFNDNSAGVSGGAINNLMDATMLIGNDASFSGNSAGSRGGAINNSSSTMLIGDDASFSGNSAGFVGGAFSNTLGSTTIGNNAIFSENSAVRFGGAIINNEGGSVIIGNNASFSGNLAETNNGGAIDNQGAANFAIGDGAKFNGNSANVSGGAIDNLSNATMRIGNDASFSGNSAGMNGGAIFNVFSENIIIGNSARFSGNSAGGNGGAIINVASIVTIGSGANFSKNSAGMNGGAIFNRFGGVLNFFTNDNSSTLFTGNSDVNGTNSIAFDNGDSTININTSPSSASTTALFDMRDPMRASNEIATPDTISINKEDDGLWALGGSNDFTVANRANFNINSGSLYLYAQDEVANATTANPAAMVAAGMLNLQGIDAGATSTFVLGSSAYLIAGGVNSIDLGTGSITIENGATIRGGSASQSLGGKTPNRNEHGGATSLTLSSDTNTQLNGLVRLAALDVADTLTLNAVLVDGTTAGSVIKNGAGTVVLTSDSSYSGDTNIQAGTEAL